jgi:WXG100 family type VII secretion target
MASEMLVTFGALANAEADIRTTAGSMNQQLADLKGYLAPLVATWEGVASSDYQAKQAQWDRAAADLNSALDRIGAAVGQALANYQQTESTNAGMWG